MGTRIAIVVVGILLGAIAAAPALGRLSPQEHGAMMLRSEALDVTYGLGKPDAMTDAAYRAVLIRSAGLNERYGLPVSLGADEIARLYGTGVESPQAVTQPAGNGFDWNYAAIAAGVVLGLALLGAGGAWMTRGHGQIPRLHH
ncbi:MAG TPA: hypothetical protein VE088_04950 [Gaiellaceae bacterium]|jgi:hypothetical protein|nr:hypothetical protein [Gaiellaceae bacterium]